MDAAVGLGAPSRNYGPYPSLGVGLSAPRKSRAAQCAGLPTEKQCRATLPPNQNLQRGEQLTSPNGRFRAVLQTDSNFVIYDGKNPLRPWGVNGTVQASMQSDGNFVMYGPGNAVLWASDTNGNGGARLVMQDDGNLVVVAPNNAGLWGSETDGPRVYEPSRGLLPKIGAIFNPNKVISTVVGREVTASVSPADIAKAAQAAISFVPGVGAGINAAIAAGAALAKGENITDALAEGAKNALPGGPIAAKAFDTAVAAGKALARGENIGDAALAGARELLPSEEAKRAFDVGLALVHGQNIQQAAIGAVAALAPHALPPALTNIAKSLPPEAVRVATAIYNRPELQAMAAAEVAKLLKTDAATVTKATQTVKSVPSAPPLSPQDAATKLFGALVLWGAKPNDVAMQQQLIGTSWQWGAAMKNTMKPEDTALANTIGAWSKNPNDTALQKKLTNVAQTWAAAKGVIPKKPVMQVHETAAKPAAPKAAAKPVAPVTSKPTAKPAAPKPIAPATSTTPKAPSMATPKPAIPTPAKPALVATTAKPGMYGPYPSGTVAGLQAPPHGHHGGGGHHGGHGGGHPIHTRMRGSPGWWWDVPWQPQTVTRTETCQTWGAPVELPPQMLTAAKVALNVSQGQPTTVRGPDNVLYLFATENGAITARPCAGSALS